MEHGPGTRTEVQTLGARFQLSGQRPCQTIEERFVTRVSRTVLVKVIPFFFRGWKQIMTGVQADEAAGAAIMVLETAPGIPPDMGMRQVT